jgi:hypothetical protein
MSNDRAILSNFLKWIVIVSTVPNATNQDWKPIGLMGKSYNLCDEMGKKK